MCNNINEELKKFLNAVSIIEAYFFEHIQKTLVKKISWSKNAMIVITN